MPAAFTFLNSSVGRQAAVDGELDREAAIRWLKQNDQRVLMAPDRLHQMTDHREIDSKELAILDFYVSHTGTISAVGLRLVEVFAVTAERHFRGQLSSRRQTADGPSKPGLYAHPRKHQPL